LSQGSQHELWFQNSQPYAEKNQAKFGKPAHKVEAAHFGSRS